MDECKHWHRGNNETRQERNSEGNNRTPSIQDWRHSHTHALSLFSSFDTQKDFLAQSSVAINAMARGTVQPLVFALF